MNNPSRESERGLALVMSLLMSVLILGLVASYLSLSTSNVQLMSTTRDRLQALCVAETGIATAVHALNAGNMDLFDELRDGVLELEQAYTVDEEGADTEVGTYRVTCRLRDIDADDDGEADPFQQLKLISMGEFNGSKRTVEVVLLRPPSFSEICHYAALVDDTIKLKPTTIISGDMHCNGKIDASHGATINPAPADARNRHHCDGYRRHRRAWYHGNLTACGEITGDTRNVSGDVVTGADRVPLPTFNIPEIIAAAEETGIPVHHCKNAKPLGGTLHGIYIFEGDCKLTGDVRTDGTAVLIVNGKTKFESGMGSLGNLTSDGKVSFMIWARDEFKMEGDLTINGVVYVHREKADLDGGNGRSPTINGSLIVSGKKLDLADKEDSIPVLNYCPPDDTLLSFMENLKAKWQAVSWREVGAEHIGDDEDD